jgi:hypothetical protein
MPRMTARRAAAEVGAAEEATAVAVPHRVAMTEVVGAMIKGVVVADGDAAADATKTIVIVEERSLFTLKCGGCGHRWEVRGCRVDDYSGTDLADEEDCPGCHEVFPVVRDGE